MLSFYLFHVFYWLHFASLLGLVLAAGVASYRVRRTYVYFLFAAALFSMLATAMKVYAVNHTVSEMYELAGRTTQVQTLLPPRQPWLAIAYYLHPLANILALVGSLTYLFESKRRRAEHTPS